MAPLEGKRLLLVDDDEDFREALADQLHVLGGLEVVEAESGRISLEAASSNHFDLILLDIGLPDSDGREICRLLRRAGIAAPIIMLSAANSDADAILSLDAGANDFIVKPLRLNVLLARMRAHLRQFSESEEACFQIGPYVFRPGARVLVDSDGKEAIRLTQTENSILKCLCRCGNEATSPRTLLKEVWGSDAEVTTHTLSTHIYRLRQKIERDPQEAKLLVKLAGGFLLRAKPILREE